MLLKRLAGMEFTAVGMNFVDKRGNDLRISILVDSVAKVKDMSSVSDITEIFNNLRASCLTTSSPANNTEGSK